jgi:hypothetical protein
MNARKVICRRHTGCHSSHRERRSDAVNRWRLPQTIEHTQQIEDFSAGHALFLVVLPRRAHDRQ